VIAMPATSARKNLMVLAAMLLAVLAWCYSGSMGQTAGKYAKGEMWKKGKFDRADRCKSCHTYPTQTDIGNEALNFVLLTEYATWKTQDKHAQAYAVLRGPRGQQMSKALKMDVMEEKAGCLNCHAMNNLVDQKGQAVPRAKRVIEGVSCGGCHGPSSGWSKEEGGWFKDHGESSWRGLPPKKKELKGMVDVRHPVKRAEICVSCHIGNVSEGKVVTHAMYAAGHPPLPPIEIATFSRNEPQHWRDMKHVPFFQNANATIKKNYHLDSMKFQRTKQALVGSIIALRETMQLIADRADMSSPEEPARVWPELLVPENEGQDPDPMKVSRQMAEQRWPELAMTHFDCFACHHDLRYPGWRQQRGYGYQLPDGQRIKGIPGRPQVRPWPMGLVELGIRHVASKDKGGGKDADVKKRSTELGKHFKNLLQACNTAPFGKPKQIRNAALDLVNWSQRLIDELMKAKYDEETALELLHATCSVRSSTYADYETARQITSLFQVVYEDLNPSHRDDKEIRQILKIMGKTLNLEPYAFRSERQRLIDEVVSRVIVKAKSDENEEGNLAEMQKFYKALQNLGSLKLQEEQKDNKFLVALGKDADINKLTEALQHRDVINKIDKINNKELKLALEKINGYNPQTFRDYLSKLSKYLPPTTRSVARKK
jgi:hypothetical protein